jgi:putative hemolysin
LKNYPAHRSGIPSETLETENYFVRFARDAADLDRVLRLRYEVFNLELNEGFEYSHDTGRDLDVFDAQCHHLIVESRADGKVIGTYRMQTLEMAEAGAGFYSDTLFDLKDLPSGIAAAAIETGRACIASAHRHGRVLFLLWHGLALYLRHNRRRYLFGCSSLTSQDPEAGLAVLARLETQGQVHPRISISPRPGYACELVEPRIPTHPSDDVPQLMALYLRHGAHVCGPPAIDREFKTIDFLTLMDVESLDRRTRKKLLGDPA